MLHFELDKTKGIATLRPNGALSAQDFESVASAIDPYIETSGHLKGIIITTETFPGWESFGSLIKHFQFVKGHHQKVAHIALVTDSVLGDFAEKVANHFVAADIKHFGFDELQEAQNWIENAGSQHPL